MDESTKEVLLTVPFHYVVPSFFQEGDPHDVAAALDVASRLPTFLGAQAERLDVKKSVRLAIEEARTAEHVADVTRIEESSRDKVHRLEQLLAEKDAKLLDLTVLQEKTLLKKEMIESAVEEKVNAVRAEEALKSKESLQGALQEAHAHRMKLEANVCEVMQERCKLTEETSQKIQALQVRINELETPMGRGNVGEVDVAACLTNMGFVVEDTSTGDYKNAGYLDLLIYPESSESRYPKIAIEVKNRKEVKRENITAFEEHVKHGIANGLFDSAILVSIRAHIKRGGVSSALDMYEDEKKRPIVPVSWIGPERSKQALPLSQDQLEAHVLLHCSLLLQVSKLRETFDKQAEASTEEDKKKVQDAIDWIATQTNELLSDLASQQTLVDSMKASITNMRVRAIHMFLGICEVNDSVTWLTRAIGAQWISVFEKARAKIDTHTDAQIWNECSHGKQVVERTIGKDAMMKALRHDSGKRRRVETKK
jgi:hypothetical protein